MKFGNLKSEATGFLNKYKSENPAVYAAAEQAVGGLLILDGFVGIDNPLGGKKRPGVFGSLFGIAFGVVFMLVPSFFGNLSGINKMTATTSATVVSVGAPQTSTTHNSDGTTNTSTSCSATVRYTVNGKEYTQASSSSSSNMCSYTPGQTVQINYNPDNPGQWASDVKMVKTVLKVFFWAGILVVVTSLVTFIIRLLSIIFGWKLLRSGRALAKTLPAGADLSSTIKSIEHEFKTSLFGFPAGTPAPTPSTAPQAAPQQPVAQPEVTPPSDSQGPQPPQTNA